MSVSVVGRALVDVKSLSSELEISSADAKRGYVEVRGVTRLVTGNDVRVGFAVDALPAAPIFSQVAISARGGETAALGSHGGELAGLRSLRSADPLLLDLRFKLLPGIMAGRYRWPLRLEVRLDY